MRLSAPTYTWDHLYDAAGQWAGDYGNAWQSEVVHLGGRALVNYQPSQSYFVHGNQLGSTSMNTDAAGNVAGDILFYPWGQVWKGSSPEWHFAGFDYRDTTANLDPTLFRQYANAQGRWLSPDPMAGNVLNPQSLNRYAYVTNNPTTLTDPLGLQQGDCLRDPACRIESYWGLGNSINPSVGSWDEFDSLRLALVGFQWNIVGYIPGTDVPILSIDPVYQLIFPANAFLDAPRIVWETSDVNRPSELSAPANNDPCANATLSATGVNIRQNIAVANFTVSVGYAAGSIGPSGNPLGGLAGALYSYDQLVHTGGSQDVKNQPGPGTPQQRVDAGNISFGVTCPFGARFCQFAAGVAQTLSGHPNPNGTLLTGFDTPSDNAGIRVGQAMRKAGCHE